MCYAYEPVTSFVLHRSTELSGCETALPVCAPCPPPLNSFLELHFTHRRMYSLKHAVQCTEYTPPTFCNTHHTHIVKHSGHSPVETLHDSAITQHSGFLLMWTLRCSLSLDQNGGCLSFAIGEVTDCMLLEEAKLNSVALQVVLLFHCQDKQWLGVPFCTQTAQWAITYRQNTSQWEIGMIISSFT